MPIPDSPTPNGAGQRIRTFSLGSPVVASTTGVHAAVTDTGVDQVVTTGITQPAVPRTITATAGGTAASIKAIQVIVAGTNAEDVAITETLPAFTVDTAGTVVGAKAFKTVTSVTIPAHDATSATTAIGFSDVLGLPLRLSRNTVVAAFLGGVKEASSTVAVSATLLESNTIDLGSALNASAVLVDFYDS